ncbi:MAG: hypothetical protein HYX32_05525 [Actinobacteria bacterium]|nr:hypothetical protein [Actinomycetota bacterium]
METNQHRVDEFRQEIAGMNIRTPADESERILLIIGMVCIGLSLVVIAFTWYQVSGLAQLSAQMPYAVSGGLLAMLLAIVGASLFVRYSMTRYLRFWLVRYIYEERSQTDREVEALERIESLLSQAVRPRQPQ